MDLPIVEFDHRGKIVDEWLNALIPDDISYSLDNIYTEDKVWVNQKDAVDWLNPDNLKTHKIYGIVLLYVKRILVIEMAENENKLNIWRHEFTYRFSPIEQTKYV